MEENFGQDNNLNNKISDNPKEPNIEEKKESKSEEIINVNENTVKSQINSSDKVEIKNEKDILNET